jgi:hypothetical protein
MKERQGEREREKEKDRETEGPTNNPCFLYKKKLPPKKYHDQKKKCPVSRTQDQGDRQTFYQGSHLRLHTHTHGFLFTKEHPKTQSPNNDIVDVIDTLSHDNN